MKYSQFLRLFAEANRKVGYKEHAEDLEKSAIIEEAKEIIKENQNERSNTNKR